MAIVNGYATLDELKAWTGEDKTTLDAIYEQRPVGSVSAHMDRSGERLIGEETEFLEIAEIFLNTVLRRLPVIDNGVLVGQVSRRDVLQTAQVMRGAGSLEMAHSASGRRVRDVMDLTSRTIGPDAQLLSIIQIFGETWFRRLPVTASDSTLLGQISRRDVLQTTLALTDAQPTREKAILYLSALLTKEEAPI